MYLFRDDVMPRRGDEVYVRDAAEGTPCYLL
jgi:hypothetical protein